MLRNHFSMESEKENQKAAQDRDNNVRMFKVIAGIWLVLFCLTAGYILLSGLSEAFSSKKSYIVYVKDNELTMAKSNQYEPIQMGMRYYENEEDAYNLLRYHGIIYENINYSPDNKYIYYPCNYDTYKSEYDLYRKKLNSKNAKEEKVASGIVYYEILDNDNLIYIKDAEIGRLYLYSNGEAEKLASDVAWAHVSEDRQHMIWLSKWNHELYVQDMTMKGDKIKLDENIISFYSIYYSENLETIVYKKENDMYLLKNFEEKEKIASDIISANVYGINDELRIYYVKEGKSEFINYYDLLEDDCLSNDQSIEEADVADSLRESLKQYDMEFHTKEVYYYNAQSNKNNKVLEISAEDFDYFETDEALMYVWATDIEGMERLRLSDMIDTDLWEIQERLNAIQYGSRYLVCLKEGECFTIENMAEDAEDCKYMWTEVNEDQHMIYVGYSLYSAYAALYGYDYSRDNALPVLIDNNIFSIADCSGEKVCYLNEDAELYYGNQKIDDDVERYTVDVYEDGTILYLVEADGESLEGTLKMYKDGNIIKIADDVAADSYKIIDGDKVIFLQDYNFNKGKGNLKVYDGKKISYVDSDVSCIVFEMEEGHAVG